MGIQLSSYDTWPLLYLYVGWLFWRWRHSYSVFHLQIPLWGMYAYTNSRPSSVSTHQREFKNLWLSKHAFVIHAYQRREKWGCVLPDLNQPTPISRGTILNAYQWCPLRTSSFFCRVCRAEIEYQYPHFDEDSQSLSVVEVRACRGWLAEGLQMIIDESMWTAVSMDIQDRKSVV